MMFGFPNGFRKTATRPAMDVIKAGVLDDSRPGCCTYYFKPQIIDFGSNATNLFCVAKNATPA
jgi:hypothetical protein